MKTNQEKAALYQSLSDQLFAAAAELDAFVEAENIAYAESVDKPSDIAEASSMRNNLSSIGGTLAVKAKRLNKEG